jgi:hypothetical protein
MNKSELKEFLIALAAAAWILRGVCTRQATAMDFLPFVVGYTITGLLWFVPMVLMWRWRELAYWQPETKVSIILRVIKKIEAL